MKSKNSFSHSYLKPSLLGNAPIAIFIITTFYILLAKISFLTTIEPETVCPIFFPAGFAFATVYILRRKALIGIGIGSFLTNIFLTIDIKSLDQTFFINRIPLALLISIGTVMACLSATLITSRLINKEHPLNRGKNVLILLILGPFIYATIAGFIGVTSLSLTNSGSTEDFWYSFKTWWLGDATGIILITPLILAWSSKTSSSKKHTTLFESSLYILITILLCLAVFFQYHSLKYLILPILFWSAYRFGIKTTTLHIIIIALFSIITTVQGIGPFNEEYLNDSILFLDLFLSVITVCSLFLAGIMTEREQTEDSIKISEKNLSDNQILLESTLESPKDVGIYSLGLNYEYLSFNSLHKHNMKIINGIDITLGMKLQDCIVNPTELEQSIAILDKVFSGESISTVGYFEANNSFWSFRTSPIINQNQEIVGATIISTDITEIKKAQENLEKSEEKYRNIFENIQDVIFQTNPNGTFLNISPSIKAVAGYNPEELIGKPTTILQTNEEEPDTIIQLVNEQFIIKNFEKLIKTKEGKTIWINLNAKMIFDKNNEPSHIDAVAQDITQRKEHEKKIASQNKKLEAQNRELEQFVYITSHDLQEPLITLKYFSDVLKTDLTKDTTENISQYLNFIMESSDRMQQLVKGLMDYSRIGHEKSAKTTDSKEIVNKAILTLADQIENSNTEIIVGDLPTVYGDSQELTELFQHLISNSIKFRKKDLPLQVTITSKKVKNNWQFTVEDNGIGIEEQNKPKLFAIFKRLHNREDYSGIGIGLAISKKIVTSHGGNIWVESVFGQGTAIHFTLPIHKEELSQHTTNS